MPGDSKPIFLLYSYYIFTLDCDRVKRRWPACSEVDGSAPETSACIVCLFVLSICKQTLFISALTVCAGVTAAKPCKKVPD